MMVVEGIRKLSTGLYHLPSLEKPLVDLPADWKLFHIPGSGITNRQAFLDIWQKVLSLPWYCNDNFDALLDGARNIDQSVGYARRYVLVYDDIQVFESAHKEDFLLATKVLKQVTEAWARNLQRGYHIGQELIIILVGDVMELPNYVEALALG